MWTGEITLKSIHTYLSGYYQALVDQKAVSKPHTADSFHDWVAKRLGYFESTAGWTNMITAYSLGLDSKNISWENFSKTSLSEEHHDKSIRIFYVLLEEFKNEKDKNPPHDGSSL